MRLCLLFLAFCLFAGTPAHAQFNKLKEKLKIKTKGDDGEKSKKKKKPLFDLGKLAGDSDIELEESYDYNFAIDWDVESEDGSMWMTQLFNTEKNYMGMVVSSKEKNAQFEKMDAIFDFDRSYLIAINPDDMRALIMEFENIEDQVANDAEEDKQKQFSIEKTSETKMIAGYLCTKYLYKGDDGSGEVWITEDLQYENIDMFSYFKKLNQQNDVETNSIWNNGVDGFILAIDGVNEDGEEFNMTATKVDKNASVSYQMGDYQKVDLSGLNKTFGGFKNR